MARRLGRRRGIKKIKKEEPYGLNALCEFNETIICSYNLKGHKTLSALIIGYPDTGKTESLMRYAGSEGIHVATDFTGYGLSELLGRIANGQIKFLIIPDLSKVLSGRGRGANQTIATLNSICEEGICHISTFHTHFDSPYPVRCGFIAALTIGNFNQWNKQWIKLGFRSRVIPFFLGYNEEDIRNGLKTIRNNVNPFSKKKLKLNLKRKIDVKITEEQKDEILKIALRLSELNKDITAFRSLRNIIAFVKAHALVRGDREVKVRDISFLKSLIPFWCGTEANDAHFYIIRNLPATAKTLAKRLPYSKSLVYRELDKLKKKGIIKKEEHGREYYLVL